MHKRICLALGLAAVAIPVLPSFAGFLLLVQGVGGSAPGVVKVWDYLTDPERAAVAAWSPADVTAGIQRAISALPITGGVLFFSPGRYQSATCGFVLSVPVMVVGSGSTDVPASGIPAQGITQIECSNNTASLFTVTSHVARFEDIGLVDTAASRSAGSAIVANGPTAESRVDYEGVVVSGFWDGIDIAASSGWHMHSFVIRDTLHYGIRIRNTVNADAGDWSISQGNIYPNGSSIAGIQIESSGGGKMSLVKVIKDAGTLQYGIRVDSTGSAPTGQLLIEACDIEQVASYPINIANGTNYGTIIITGSYLSANGGGAYINAVNVDKLVTGSNIGLGSGTYGIATSGVTNAIIGKDYTHGYQYPAGVLDNTSVVDYSGLSYTVGGLPAASSVPAGTRLFVTNATATTFHSIAAGGGSNAIAVVSDGTNWLIGG